MKNKQLLANLLIITFIFLFACKTKEKEVEGKIVSTADSSNPIPNEMSVAKSDTAMIQSDKRNSIEKTPTKPEETVRASKKHYQSRINFVPYEINQNMKIEVDSYGVYNRAEIMPSFPGGEEALKRFIQKYVVYPETALENGVEGTVLLAFMVDESGKIYTPSIESAKIGSGLEQESVRLVNQMPKWNPGQIKGRNVKTRFTLPIKFEIF